MQTAYTRKKQSVVLWLNTSVRRPPFQSDVEMV